MEMTGETGVDWRNCCQSVMLFTSTSRALMENSLSHSVYSTVCIDPGYRWCLQLAPVQTGNYLTQSRNRPWEYHHSWTPDGYSLGTSSHNYPVGSHSGGRRVVAGPWGGWWLLLDTISGSVILSRVGELVQAKERSEASWWNQVETIILAKMFDAKTRPLKLLHTQNEAWWCKHLWWCMLYGCFS